MAAASKAPFHLTIAVTEIVGEPRKECKSCNALGKVVLRVS
jgi:hypothetical protein